MTRDLLYAHHPMCPFDQTYTSGMQHDCQCDLIARVRDDLHRRVSALRPYEDGRISKGMVLAILEGEVE